MALDPDLPAYVLDPSPLAMFTRLQRVGLHLEALQDEAMAEIGLTFSDYTILATLHREPPPHRLPVSRLAELVLRPMGSITQVVDRIETASPGTRYLWFSDADIEHDPPVLRGLVAEAEAGGLDLVSHLALLNCAGGWEKLLIPSFVFFYRKLYPFRWVNDGGRATASAAGGCMLVRRSALARAGGVGAIRGALIDDCALARAIKPGGAIRLELTMASRSLRAYPGLRGIWNMVARSAFTQLGHSAALLAATVLGMFVVYLGPPIGAIAGGLSGAYAAAGLGAAAWLLMAVAYAPTLKHYGRPAPVAAWLPAAALLYTLMTIDSACRHWRGDVGRWKGRILAGANRRRR